VGSLSNLNAQRRFVVLTALCMTMLCAGGMASAKARPDERPADAVGVIEGEAISVTGPMTVEVVHGQSQTMLRSGSEVRVKSGTARIDLVEGGQISICGPAHLSVLKSGGALTIALDTGTMHVHVEEELAVNIYTPQLQAQTVSIGGGPRDVMMGFDAEGALCLRANRGAVRLEQQLTGQGVMIPQAGDVLLVNGQLDGLRTSAGHCACEPQSAKAAEPRAEVSRPATAEEVRQQSADAEAKAQPSDSAPSPPKEEPIYQVFMPPLVYDAKAKVQPEYDPRLIVLVRRVRVRPSVVFQGRVEGVSTAAAVPAPPAPAPAATAKSTKPAAPTNDSFVDRVRNFVRKLWSSGS